MTEITYEVPEADGSVRLTKGGLLLRDTLVFLALLLITVALFGVTFFLFRSFESHREDLAHDWAAQGTSALQHGQPASAVSSLRAALSYAPDEHAYQLLLAEALADAGHTEEANNYFLNLWSARPGDGFINLQLARLARKHGETQQAIEYYRAAIYGDWQGDGLERRRETRLELAAYLASQNDVSSARTELLILAGNAPDNAPLNLLIGDRLTGIDDPSDAMTYYQRALADQPHDPVALAKAGVAAYEMNDFATAHTLLNRAEHLRPEEGAALDPQLAQKVSSLAHNADRLLELSLSRELPAVERARHIKVAAGIAQSRLNRCIAQATPPGAPPALPALSERWKAAGDDETFSHLAENATDQDRLTQLIFDTELQTAEVCRPPAPGDDDLLLLLARNSRAGTPIGGGTP